MVEELFEIILLIQVCSDVGRFVGIYYAYQLFSNLKRLKVNIITILSKKKHIDVGVVIFRDCACFEI